jgi:hypothetical protein
VDYGIGVAMTDTTTIANSRGELFYLGDKVTFAGGGYSTMTIQEIHGSGWRDNDEGRGGWIPDNLVLVEAGENRLAVEATTSELWTSI